MHFHLQIAALCLTVLNAVAADAPSASTVTISPGKNKQVIKGIGFEIQSDSIGSGNQGLPDEPIAVPHDLIPAERERLATEMLKGFRYCRLAGGLYWRGLDAEKKFLRPRWPEQLIELRELLNAAGVEGLSFEYWSPAPFWKGNRSYCAQPGRDSRAMNRLRCFAPGFAEDAEYKGDTNRFLADFATAVVADIKTLADAGLKTSMWGLQNEPNVNHSIYSSCEYPDSASYVQAYAAVAAAVRKHDPTILLFADTEHGYPKKIGPAMNRPEIAKLVDAYAVHIVGSPSETPSQVHNKIKAKLPPRPWFQNEYEYLTGGATPERCLNTVQHIMNSFQLAENPTWFWIHALKPVGNAEASGYSLGFWKSLTAKPNPNSAEQFRRWPGGPEFVQLPDLFKKLELISVKRLQSGKPAIGYNFMVNQPVTVYLLAQDGSEANLEPAWQKTEFTTRWDGGRDSVFRRKFPAGRIEIPAPGGVAVAHSVFVEPLDAAKFKAEIGMNLPIEIRSLALELERKAAAVPPGHWIFNPYNWNAVGSFVKRMPWDSVVVEVTEKSYHPDARIFAFKKPDGKLTVVLSNRTPGERAFTVNTGLAAAEFKGFRYTPDEAGQHTMGVTVGSLTGGTISPKLPRLSWEFWEQQ
jgi:O-glycosyl hydrolase